jgi:hypothetical protein
MKGILKTHSTFFRTLFHILDPLVVAIITYFLYSQGINAERGHANNAMIIKGVRGKD